MPERRHQSPRDSVRTALLVLPSVLFTLLIAGCDKIQIPDLGQQPAGPAGGAGSPPVGQAVPGGGAGTGAAPAAKPDPKVAVNAFIEKNKQIGQLEDQDLERVTESTEGLEQVTQLTLIGSKITDKGVARLSKFPRLESVDLSASMVTSEGLAVVKEMPALRNLSLGNTTVDDKAMIHIAERTELKELNLAKTGVTDFGISLLKDLKELEVLDISSTTITGKGFEKFKGTKTLRVLKAQHSGLQNEAMKYLAHCPFEELNLDVTGISDQGMKFIGKMSKLRKLSLEYCGVSEFGIKQMVIMKDLETISLRNNGLVTGQFLIPKLKTSKNLQFVNVAGTKVSSMQCAMLMKLIPGCKVSN